MIHGLFLDPRSWEIDFNQPYGERSKSITIGDVCLDLHPNAFDIPKTGVKGKYKFVVATEVWEIPMRKTLQYLRNKGLKIFLVPREPFKTNILKDAMFSYERFFWNNEYYFTPDVVIAPGEAYGELWVHRCKTYVTGYPRFDYYAFSSRWSSKNDLAKKYPFLDPNKKWVFFPDYPPYHYKKEGDKDTMVDLFDAREGTLKALHSFGKANKDYQMISKIHPASMKPFLKGKGNGKEVSGLLLRYYQNPGRNLAVIGDQRNDGLLAKELLINSDIVCGFTSTMLLEAGVLKKPIVHILFGNTKDLQGIPEYAKHLPVAYNESELHSLLHNVEYLPNPMIKRYLFMVDGRARKKIFQTISEEMR